MTVLRGFSPSCPARWSTPLTGRPNLLAKVDLAASELGVTLMDHQRLIAAVATETEGGRLVYRQATVTIPRQQGKSTLILCVMVALAWRRPRTQIVYTAQTRLDARRMMFDEWWPMIAASRLGRVCKPRRAAGGEALLFANGSRIGLVSGSLKAGHGNTIDAAVVDECWAQPDDRLEQAFRPAMLTRPDPQLYLLSTAGTDASVYLRAKVDDGRGRAELGVTDTACYLEWSAADEADPADPATWHSAMPALGPGGTVDEDAVAADLELMELSEFRRACLNQWPEIARPGWAEISEEAWMSCHNPEMTL
jgi:phage terminase large subunit-like protein